jgi:parallel beta-helix repeat protein
MSVHSWVRKLFARPITCPIRRAPHRFRPAAEVLEDRTVPSQLLGTNLLDDGSGGPVLMGSHASTLHPFPDPQAAALQQAASANGAPYSIPYNGGSLLTHVQVEGMYYNDPITLGLQSKLDGFFADFVHSSWLTQVLANYSVGNQTIGTGSFLGDDDTGLPVPQGGALTDAAIQNQLSIEVANGRLVAPSASTDYAVFLPPLPPGSSPRPGAIAYHGEFFDARSGKVITYMVLWGNPNDLRFNEFQSLTDVTSHELYESITDPGAGLRTPAHPQGDWAWTSVAGEIGDAAQSGVVTYDGYLMQEVWGRSPTDPPNLALGPVVAPTDTDFAVTRIYDPKEGSNNGVLATFTDRDGASELPSQFLVEVAWGDNTSSRSDDGTGDVTVTSNGDGTFNIVGRHSYLAEAGQTLGHNPPLDIKGASVFVSSGDELTKTAQPITLQEVATPLTNLSPHSFLFAPGQALTNQVVATFTDPGGTAGADPNPSEYRASINWGDGTPIDTNVTIWANGNGHYSVVGNSHLYTSAGNGPYQVSVTIADDDSIGEVEGQAIASAATTFTVTSLLDDGSVGSLRWAIGQANQAMGFATINFAPSLFSTPQTIHLSGAPLELSNTSATETITGPTVGVTVSGDGKSGVFLVDAGVNASLSGLAITGGKTAGSGGGLADEGGIIALTNCTLSGSSAGLTGGGLYDYLGLVMLSKCTISGNSAGYGSAVFNYGEAILTDCTVTGNSATASAGGLENFGSATLTNCAISGNSAGISGGGLENYGAATLTNCTVTGNSATVSAGGGLDNFGTATLTNCTVSGNSAGFGGGGLESRTTATTTLTNCTVTSNSAAYGGGLRSVYGTIEMNDCTVSGNSAGIGGGGLSSRYGAITLTTCTVTGNSGYYGGGLLTSGPTALTNCTVSGNSAVVGGGLLPELDIALTNCTVSGNSAVVGGGVFNNYGDAALTDCTVCDNSAVIGGGLFSTGYFFIKVALTNCTLSGNSASLNGGGVYINQSTATLTNCTVSGNTAANAGAGLYGTAFAVPFTLSDTIVAGNANATLAASDISGSAAGTNNLIGPGGSGGLVNGANGNLVGVANILLAPLGNYGGPTQTMPLLPGSPAIDAGTSTGAPAFDERGSSRVGAVDIGAFESQGFTIAITSGSDQSTNISTAFSAPLVVTVTAHNPSEPVAGGLVTFTPPASGASATIGGSPATISATGTASVTATADGVAGHYTVSATARGITTPASISLSNRPTIIVPAAQTADQNVDQTISGISIGDAPGDILTVTLSVSHGTLTLGTTAGLTTVARNGSGALTLTGTTTNLNAALATLVYRGSHNFSGGDTLSLTATDGGVSSTPASVAITVESIAQQAASLQSQVSTLQSAGVLNHGQANSLSVKLNLEGDDGDIGRVQAFLDEVAAYLNAGILTQAQADALQYWGNILLLSVTRR